ncbi:hypothetical protein ACFSRY_11175 [Pontibacter locisalis]|uniref:YD repeat-containing protein n=1 Tax=Pontibacter locisalis TaxID=1719035 RepID=A0ABW5IR12_9BACT
MKLKNKFLPAMLMFGVVAFSSCDKSEQETLEPEFEQGTLSRIMADSSEVTSYDFAGKQVSQVNHYNTTTSKVESFEKFIYDAKGKLIKATTHAGANHAVLSEQAYIYNDKGMLTTTTTSYFNGGKTEYSSYSKYEYTTDKKLKKKTVYEGTESADAAGIAKSFTTYEALPNGNYTQEKQHVVDDKGKAKLFSTTTYSYDASHNPFFEFAEPGTTSSPNNLLASSTLVHGSNKTYKYTYSYKYDDNGYPVSQTVTKPDGTRETFTYVYSN